jgi:sRNA-binding carbon storage regulator CsrA
MLVVSRHRHEKIVIDVPPSDQPTKIVICIVDIQPARHGGRTRIGFEAHVDVKIARKELLDGSAT